MKGLLLREKQRQMFSHKAIRLAQDVCALYFFVKRAPGPRPITMWLSRCRNTVHVKLLFQIGNMIRPVTCLSMYPLLYLTCCEVSPRSEALLSESHDDGEAFCKLMDHCCGRSTVGRECKSVSRVRVYSGKNKTSPLP